jgi:myo-inositol-1(or 4)-monophosphatase
MATVIKRSGERVRNRMVGMSSALEMVAIEIVRQAGTLLLDRPQTLEVATKSSEVDVVTQMDKASEELVRKYLEEHRPDDGLLGEEGVDIPSKSGITWICDPIDGTVNYLYELPGWCISLAAEEDGEVVAGAVYAPLLYGGAIWSATKGGGAWLQMGDGERKRLSVSEPPPMSRALLATGFSYSAETRRAQGARFAKMIEQVRDIRRMGAAAVDLCLVASGAVDGYFEEGLNPWDLAAGGLIATEAGALVTNLAGGKADVTMVVAAHPALNSQIRELIDSVAGG